MPAAIPLIGLIVPPAHGRVPDDGPRVYDGRARFIARGLGIDDISAEGFAPVMAALCGHALKLRDEGAQAISVMGTSLCFHRGITFTDELRAQLEDATGLPCTTMSHAVVRGLRVLGARRVAVATAYTGVLNDDLVRFLAEADIEVAAIEGLGMTGVLAVADVSADTLRALARRVRARAPTADALLVSCGGLRTLDLLAPLEAELALPIVASSPAGFWDVMRTAGLDARATGFGQLFEHTAHAHGASSYPLAASQAFWLRTS